ncbi:WD40 repeat-like protein [Wolfiporia cocos MD-104 SS10]|uniref:WD40 repeat-like protein n=1 Tax=Wolfiporia cocos (strain MD-104) TaxID=742152 RepID=A0A2H3JGS1_WOLCO|nr:WD40 repeat-like protein [Wolfiporia cocos MD-104 SS10]
MPPKQNASRIALVNRTNVPSDDGLLHFFPHTSGKRPLNNKDERDPKRVKLALPKFKHQTQDSDDSSDSDEYEPPLRRAQPGRFSAFGLISSAMTRTAPSFSRYPSTRPILQSFVSSNKTDLFKCHSDSDAFFSVPYACAYSHGAKQGSTALLAIATEKGALHILNTEKRQPWDCEPPRTVFNPHQNGVFDAKWSPTDTLVATASGDQSARITVLDSSVSERDRTLHVLTGYHQSTIKCLAWDPSRGGNIICTGGRDGMIFLWDLRVGEGRDRRASRSSGGGTEDSGREGLCPVIAIPRAHELEEKPRGRRGKQSNVRTITSLVYPEADPYCLISSCSYDGILRQWDFRALTGPRRHPTECRPAKPVCISADATTLQGTHRARGITSLAPGHGPSAGLLFALGTDSRIHTYAAPSLEPLSGYTAGMGVGLDPETDPWMLTHTEMKTNSFYVRLSVSPCGRWLASGNAMDGRVFLFDISNTASRRMRAGMAALGGYSYGRGDIAAVELRGQAGEVGALDWAQDMLATCADDASVRIWRPDVDIYRECVRNVDEMRWNWSWAVGET